jgi:hypothetical protein
VEKEENDARLLKDGENEGKSKSKEMQVGSW